MDLASIAHDYRRWADVEAAGSSPTYHRLAYAVADDARALRLLSSLEPPKRQPNLVFAAVRRLGGPVHDPQVAVPWLVEHADDVLAVVRSKRTQTNEVARCSALLVALATLPPPLALVEVGASAGLCLLLDAWAYRYAGEGVDHRLGPADAPLTLTCRVQGPARLPSSVPRIAWRAGLDLAPVDPRDPEQRGWLETLVWPEHEDRVARLRAALTYAAAHPVTVTAGDLVADLPRLLGEVPAGATPVVLHSAALAYVGEEQRRAFLRVVEAAGAHRVGMEGPAVLPHLATPDDVRGRFVVSVDDDVVGLADPHGGDFAAL